jgi:hypothetical protein
MDIQPTSKRQRLKLHKIPVTAYLEPEQLAALRALSLRTHVPQVEYIRQGLTLILKAQALRSTNGPGPEPARSALPQTDP